MDTDKLGAALTCSCQSTQRDVFFTRGPTPVAYLSQSGLELRCTLEHHDWQVASLVVEANGCVEPLAGLPSDKSPRLGTRRSPWPAGPWFDSGLPIGRETTFIDFIRSLAAERHERSMLIVPLKDRD